MEYKELRHRIAEDLARDAGGDDMLNVTPEEVAGPDGGTLPPALHKFASEEQQKYVTDAMLLAQAWSRPGLSLHAWCDAAAVTALQARVEEEGASFVAEAVAAVGGRLRAALLDARGPERIGRVEQVDHDPYFEVFVGTGRPLRVPAAEIGNEVALRLGVQHKVGELIWALTATAIRDNQEQLLPMLSTRLTVEGAVEISLAAPNIDLDI